MLLGITKVGNKNVAPFVWGAIAARDLTVKRKTQIPRTSRVPPPPLRPGGLGRYCPILASQSPGGGGGVAQLQSGCHRGETWWGRILKCHVGLVGGGRDGHSGLYECRRTMMEERYNIYLLLWLTLTAAIGSAVSKVYIYIKLIIVSVLIDTFEEI